MNLTKCKIFVVFKIDLKELKKKKFIWWFAFKYKYLSIFNPFSKHNKNKTANLLIYF